MNMPGTNKTALIVIPRATYRLQFHSGFTFKHAQDLVPYLSELGISHCYSSPYLKARAGSLHGYDIVDHTQLNPEIGTRDDFDNFVATLTQHGMSQILDMVPNHMGVGGADNKWWLDVLENGQGSTYSNFFDIFWRPLKDELRGKVLLPFLGGHYGEVLTNADIQLEFDSAQGAFTAHYYQHLLPIDPQTYPIVMAHALDHLERRLESGDLLLREYKSLISSFEKLPDRFEIDAEKISERQRDKEVYKQRFAELCRRAPAIQQFIAENVAIFNGDKGNAESFDLLHRLLDKQAYRLAFWQVASHEINYRRFFDINDLAGLNTSNPTVLNITHSLVAELIANGSLQGLRIDHPDGLTDPKGYYQQLREFMCDVSSVETENLTSIYIVVEKILAAHEHLPEDWPVQGTTGYDFVNLVNGVFIDQKVERDFDITYSRFVDQQIPFDDLLYTSKKLIAQRQLSSELNVLAHALDRISEADRYTRDFTLTGLREAITEVVACFPVYRTYVTAERVSAEDKRYVDWAVAQAKRRSASSDSSIYDFIRNVLLCEWSKQPSGDYAASPMATFMRKFQQYSAPVMAKGLEDTCFYIYNRLLSLNEVGGDPRRFGVSVSAFHHLNQERFRRWPHSMLCTSSHDTKRSEDVRMRINVLTEMPNEWRGYVLRWRQMNRRKKTRAEQQTIPSRNDEYFLYQTLIGVWPLEPLTTETLSGLRERIEAYMIKAVREAKVYTSWININPDYEDAIKKFVNGLLVAVEKNPFLQSFLPFQRMVAHYGMLNSLVQTTLKLTVPGMPDFYQGTEIWDFSLVDPDNRRPVNFELRKNLLGDIQMTQDLPKDKLIDWLESTLTTMADGKIKLYLTWRLLKLRSELALIFQFGSYTPLIVSGNKAEHVIAFMREYQGQCMVVITGRLFYSLMPSAQGRPLAAGDWQDTSVIVPCANIESRFTNCFTKEKISPKALDLSHTIPLSVVLNRLPCAVLKLDI